MKSERTAAVLRSERDTLSHSMEIAKYMSLAEAMVRNT